MIRIEFTITEESLDPGVRLDELIPGAMGETCFEMPIYIWVDRVNIVGCPGGTLVCSVVGLAASLRNAINRLETGGTESVYIPGGGYLNLKRNLNDRVEFTANKTPRNVSAPYEDVLAAFRGFADQVQQVIESRVPYVRNHPDWDILFPAANSRRSSPRRD